MQVDFKSYYDQMHLNLLNENEINYLVKHNEIDQNLISDNYHTFGELYEFRKLYNAGLFNEWAKTGQYDVHKSHFHHEGDECFGGGWFIVVAILPGGQISNHYKNEDWDLFNIPEHRKAKYPYDGHTTKDVIERLKGAIQQPII